MTKHSAIFTLCISLCLTAVCLSLSKWHLNIFLKEQQQRGHVLLWFNIKKVCIQSDKSWKLLIHRRLHSPLHCLHHLHNRLSTLKGQTPNDFIVFETKYATKLRHTEQCLLANKHVLSFAPVPVCWTLQLYYCSPHPCSRNGFAFFSVFQHACEAITSNYKTDCWPL